MTPSLLGRLTGTQAQPTLWDRIRPNEADSDRLAAIKGTVAAGVGSGLGYGAGELVDSYVDDLMRLGQNTGLATKALRENAANAAHPERLRTLFSEFANARGSAVQRMRRAAQTSPAARAAVLNTLRAGRDSRRTALAFAHIHSLAGGLGALGLGTALAAPYIQRFVTRQSQIQPLLKKSAVKQALSEEAERNLRNTIGTTLGGLIPGLISTAYGLGAFSRLPRSLSSAVGFEPDNDGSGTLRKLYENATPADRKYYDEMASKLRAAAKTGPLRTSPRTLQAAMPFEPHYSPEARTVHMGIFRHPGILAHELGHAEQPWHHWTARENPRWKRVLGGLPAGLTRIAPFKATMLSTLVSSVAKDDSAARDAAIMASASYVPLLAEEFDAGRRGFRLMTQVAPKAKLLHRLSPFLGLPTYLAAATAPLAGYAGRKLLGAKSKNGGRSLPDVIRNLT